MNPEQGIRQINSNDYPHYSDERSQFQNKQAARQRLLPKLMNINAESKAASQKGNWTKHDSLVRGNPVRKFSGPL